MRALVVVGLLVAGCGGSAAPAPSAPVPASSKEAAAPPGLEPCVRPAAAKASTTPPGRVRTLLGDAAIAVLGAPAKVEAFRMKLDPDGASREHSPANAERIAGYLVAGSGRPVSNEIAAKLAALLEDDATYDFEPRKPCAAGALFGFRFTKEAQSVEVAFELSGERVYIATADEPFRGRAWSARFTPGRAAVLGALRGAFAGDAELPAQ